MKNLLPELGVEDAKNNPFLIDDSNENIDVNNAQQENPADNELDQFFSTVNSAQTTLEHMHESLEKIKVLHNSILVSPSEDRDAKNQLTQHMEKFKLNAKSVKNTIDKIDQQIKNDQKVANTKPSQLQIERNQHYSLLKNLTELMTEYSKIQTQYRDDVAKRIERQAAIAGQSVTYEDIEGMIESGNMSTLFDQVAATEKSKQTLVEIEQRHNDILLLEKNLNDLHELFTDLSLLIDQQGEIIDRIDLNVDNAVEYVNKGEIQLVKAVKLRRKNIKKKIIIWGIVLFIVFIIVLIIALKLKK